MLHWRNLIPSTDRRFLVKGHVLNVAICGPRQRFALEEVRSYTAEGYADRLYRLRDVELISDADVKAGKMAIVVGTYVTIDEALLFINHSE